MILKLIAEKPRHGYEVIKAIEELVAGAYSPSPGVVYPTLTLLEEFDWIRTIPSEGSKTLYEATADGSLALEANKAIIQDIMARIAASRKAGKRETAIEARLADEASSVPKLQDALDDLKRAIEQRLAGHPLTAEQVAAMTAILSRAATEMAGV